MNATATNLRSQVSVKDLFERYGKMLELALVAGEKGLNRKIKVPEVERPGLALAGYFRGAAARRMIVFGRGEIEFLKGLPPELRTERLMLILKRHVPAVIVARGFTPPKELITICRDEEIPLFRTYGPTMQLISKLTMALSDIFAPTMSCHGTLVEAFGIGVLIQGDSSVGKSETALGLIERGHRLISDDVVMIKRREGGILEGRGHELTRHMLEIRGIGLINVANLFGAVCISESKRVDIVVRLEEWDDSHFYDRVGLEEKHLDFLGIQVPFYVVPLKSGRDIVLLLETVVLNHRLKLMGYHSAKEFNVKLLDTIARRSRR